MSTKTRRVNGMLTSIRNTDGYTVYSQQLSQISEYLRQGPKISLYGHRPMSSVEHIVCQTPFQGFLYQDSYTSPVFSSVYADFYIPASLMTPMSSAPTFMRRAVDSAVFNLLDFDNNEFELLPFLFDLDGTIAMFAKKFWTSLTYGSLTWGVLPFISDLKALLASLRDILSARSFARQWITKSRSVTLSRPHTAVLDRFQGGTYVDLVYLSGVCRASGYVDFTIPDLDQPLSKALFLLDELGVHPDLKTAWDIIPLSFVVDYFLPIGSLLETVHPRGWGSTAFKFYGSLSYKLECLYKSGFFVNGVQRATLAQQATVSRYARSLQSGFSPAALPFDWSAPSLKEVFNTTYLLTKLKNTF